MLSILGVVVILYNLINKLEKDYNDCLRMLNSWEICRKNIAGG